MPSPKNVDTKAETQKARFFIMKKRAFMTLRRLLRRHLTPSSRYNRAADAQGLHQTHRQNRRSLRYRRGRSGDIERVIAGVLIARREQA